MGDGAARGHGVAERVRLLGGQHPGHQGGDHRVLQVSRPRASPHPAPPLAPFPASCAPLPGPRRPRRLPLLSPRGGAPAEGAPGVGSHPAKFTLQAVASRGYRDAGTGVPRMRRGRSRKALLGSRPAVSDMLFPKCEIFTPSLLCPPSSLPSPAARTPSLIFAPPTHRPRPLH